MRIQKQEITTRVDAPGAVARQQTDFGEVPEALTMGAEYFSLATGADMKPLLEGLENDLCHSPHWGYVISGELLVTYRDGSEETTRGGDMFYWPPWHTVRATDDAEFVMFSPQHQHGPVIDHVHGKVAGG